MAKAVLNKSKAEGKAVPDFKLYSKAAVTKTAYYWYENSHIDKWDRTEVTEANPHNCGHLILDKGAKKCTLE